MTLRFRRSMKILPGIMLNLGIRSAGLSIGPRGAHVGWNTRRGTYASAGLPGTGFYAFHYSKTGAGYRVNGNVAGSTFSFFVVAIAVAAILSLFVRFGL